MPRLADLQADFAAALTDPTRPAPPGLRRETKTAQSRRFDVYRNNMAVGLIEALEVTFPAVRRLVGTAFFRAAARVYIRRHPPRSPVLLLYGDGFADFLEAFEPAQSVPYLGDVARLEWARVDAFHAADAAPLSIQCLADVPEVAVPHLRFALHPSLRLVSSRYPVASLWAATSGADPEAADTEVDMSRGEAAAVLRPGLTVETRVLPDGGFDFLSALAAGRGLGQATGEAMRNRPGFDLARHLRGLFDLGAVVKVISPRS